MTQAVRRLTGIVTGTKARRLVLGIGGRGSAGCLAALGLAAQCSAGPFDIAHYMYVGSDPDDERLNWSDSVQGIAHDDSNWFITQTQRLWRAPASLDLGTMNQFTPLVTTMDLSEVPELVADGYDHFGDIVCFQHDGRGYVIVPIEALPDRSGIAVFRAHPSLAYVDHINLFPDAASRQSHWSWVAVDPEGRLLSSDFDDVDRFIRYEVDWDHLNATDELLISNETAEEILVHEGGLVLSKVQGGEFTPGGELLYILTGFPFTDGGGHGIHVFETSRFLKVTGSSNGSGHFNYEFHPFTGDEPEGLTIWDLEGTESPHRGQLHALLQDHEVGDTGKIYIKHYTDVIMVDSANTGTQTGTPERPFRTIAGALGLAWGGAEVRSRAGNYPESLTITQCVRLSAENGIVRVGD